MFSKTSWASLAGIATVGLLLGWLVAAALVVLAGPAQADTSDFVSAWKTDNTSLGSSGVNQVRLPLESGGTYNFDVDWESDDKVDETITAWDQAIHTYASAGTYTITISFPNKSSRLSGWRFNYGGDRLKILNISQWGGRSTSATTATTSRVRPT